MKSILERLRALERELPQTVLVTLPGGKQAAVDALTAFEIAVHNGAATFSVPDNPPMERLLQAVADAVTDDET
ncbi:hypothetical protein MR730_02140 [bacterium]|nr:hypothetical protein [bacterium]